MSSSWVSPLKLPHYEWLGGPSWDSPKDRNKEQAGVAQPEASGAPAWLLLLLFLQATLAWVRASCCGLLQPCPRVARMCAGEAHPPPASRCQWSETQTSTGNLCLKLVRHATAQLLVVSFPAALWHVDCTARNWESGLSHESVQSQEACPTLPLPQKCFLPSGPLLVPGRGSGAVGHGSLLRGRV